MSGSLFGDDIHQVYESLSLSLPVWMSHGVRDDFKDCRGESLVHDEGNCRTTVFPTGALSYFAVPDEFILALDASLNADATSTDRLFSVFVDAEHA